MSIKGFFKEQWTQLVVSTIVLLYPDINDAKLLKAVTDIYDENLKDEPVRVENNYTMEYTDYTLTSFLNWFNKAKPITTEYGVLFKQHHEAKSLINEMVDSILTKRSVYKKLRNENLSTDSAKAQFYDLRQQVMKIFANSIYGVLGNKAFIFYNLFNAEAITKTGQNMITTCYAGFENYLEDNIPFMSMDEFFLYINNILDEDSAYDIYDFLDRPKTHEELKIRLRKKFMKANIINEELFNRTIDNLNEAEVQYVYYKNSFREFTMNKKVKKIFKRIFSADVNFRDPNKVPKDIKDDLDFLFDVFKEIVFYNHLISDSRYKFKNLKRKVVVLVDTDSNMLNLDPYYEFFTELLDLSDDKELEYNIINVVSFLAIETINEYLITYCKNKGIQDEKFFRLTMKNEFLFRTLLLTKGKKNYAGLIILQEGEELPEKKQLQLKGISIRKNNVNKKTSKFLSDILEHKVLRKDTFDIKDIIDDLDELAYRIDSSFKKGSRDYMTPASSKSPGQYDFPFRNVPLRGIHVWNSMYPSKEITFPAQVNTVKLNCNTLDDLKKIKDDFPNEYKKIKSVIFEDPEIASYGFTVFSMPKKEEEIPDWVRPLIDIDTIVNDNLKNFIPLSESIDIKTIYSKKDTKFISNIVGF